MAESPDSSTPTPASRNRDRARAIARSLLQIQAVDLRPDDPFEWSSGLYAPMYCDNRRTLAYPAIRSTIAEGLAETARDASLLPATIAGTATAGIPHAAWLAGRLDAPMCYVRSSAKGHGRKNRIEGVVEAGDPVVVVEDLISTGSSALSAVDALREAGAEVRAVLAIFSYEFDRAADAFREADVPLHTLTGFRTLLDVATDAGHLTAAQIEALRDWRRDPDAWSDAVAAGR
jgi:orotate phosphoribosyltransferase